MGKIPINACVLQVITPSQWPLSPGLLLEPEVSQGGPLVVDRHSQGPFWNEMRGLPEESLCHLAFIVITVNIIIILTINISQVKNLEII